jgi:hypothetical protein
MNKVCDAGAFCLQRPQCEYRCHLTNAVLEPEQETRKLRPYPSVPDDITPVPEAWQMIGSVLVGVVLVALVVIAALFFFTGFYIWTLLI